MASKDRMIRIRCTGKTKTDFEEFTRRKKFKNLEDSLLFLIDYHEKTKHLTKGEVY